MIEVYEGRESRSRRKINPINKGVTFQLITAYICMSSINSLLFCKLWPVRLPLVRAEEFSVFQKSMPGNPPPHWDQ
jgi:hypothetical protein